MQSTFYRVGDSAINFDNIQFVNKVKREQGIYFEVYFAGSDQPLQINGSTPGGKALLNWWENMVPVLLDGTEEPSTFKLPR
jgi:hypothetical protein